MIPGNTEAGPLVENNPSESKAVSRVLANRTQPVPPPPPSSTSLELTNFAGPAASNTQQNLDLFTQETSAENVRDTAPDGLFASHKPPLQEPLASGQDQTASPLHPLTRQQTGPAIGPSTDKPIHLPKDSETLGPTLFITLLLTNGARHPYKIDEKYLKKRNVNVDGTNPINMSTYTLKELIWREWREGSQRRDCLRLLYSKLTLYWIEWEARPSSPSSIRLIYYGKLLEDKSRLEGK